jgi:ATP-dependent Zn protease
MANYSSAQEPYTGVTKAFFTSMEAQTDMPRLNRADKPTRLTASKKVTNLSYTTTSTSHQNKKKNTANLKLNPKYVAKTRLGTKGPVQICNKYGTWIMILWRMNPYDVFLRMIHYLLWMSRHQKQGDRRSYLQMCRQKASQEKQNFP